MSTIAVNTFTSFEMNESEKRSSVILTTLQRQSIHNLIAHSAEQQLALEFDGNNPIKFAQDQAFLVGQIKILQYILELSDEAEQEIVVEMNNKEDEGDN